MWTNFRGQDHKGKRYNPIVKLSQKPYRQIVKTPTKGGTTGAQRRFVGLKPGHTYRLTTRVNTMKMHASKNDWSLSVHMAHNGSAGATLNGKQMAGLESLPNGLKGLKVGQIAEFNTNKTTQGEYVERSGKITLPDGVDSITVWIRHSSSKATSGVGIDWIKLEDLGKLIVK